LILPAKPKAMGLIASVPTYQKGMAALLLHPSRQKKVLLLAEPAIRF